MSYYTVKLTKTAFVKELLAKTFPDYKGRTFSLSIDHNFYYNPYWNEGSRTSYAMVDMASGKAAGGDGFGTEKGPWNNKAIGYHEMPQNVIVVEHSIYGGKDAGIVFRVHPANREKFQAEITAANKALSA